MRPPECANVMVPGPDVRSSVRVRLLGAEQYGLPAIECGRHNARPGRRAVWAGPAPTRSWLLAGTAEAR